MASRIQEYLAQVRAAGATPTFTNIGGENPMLKPGPGRPMGGTQIPGAYLIEEQNQPMMDAGGQVSRPQAIPQPQAQPQAQPGNDPWAMAQQNIKKLMPEIWKELFPNKQPGEFMTQAENTIFQKALKSTRNALVDMYKYQIDQVNKGKARQKKDSPNEISIKDRGRRVAELQKDYNKLYNDPYTRPQLEGKTQNQWVMEQFNEWQSMVGGQAIPTPGEAQQPMSKGPMPQGQAAQGPMPPMMQEGAPAQGPDPQLFQKAVKALSTKHKGDRQMILAELRQQFPNINLPTY